jgi:alginate O-acetyltransferase complex protein AlgI
MENFRRPYAASSFQDFWKRWHISLSSWFRDYLYIPLGGSRVTVPHWVVNVLIVFVLSGLWHGANWTFAAWGAVHGVYLMVGRFTYRLRQDVLQRSGWSESPALRLFQVVITFHLTCLAWIFFRADSIQDAFYVLSHLIPTELRFSGYGLGLTQTELLLTLLAVVGMDLVERARERGSLSAWFRSRPLAWRWTAYYSAIFVLFFFGKFGRNEFIYFQF